MFENPRRGRQARNFSENDPKILDLKSSSEQIIFRKLSLGAPDKPIVHSGFNSAAKIIYHRTSSNVSSIKQETAALKNPCFFFALIENSHTLFYRKSQHTFMACEANIHWKNTLMICLIQKQLDFVESIFSNVLTDGTGGFCNGVLHSLFNHRNGSISVVWTLWWSKTVTT